MERSNCFCFFQRAHFMVKCVYLADSEMHSGVFRRKFSISERFAPLKAGLLEQSSIKKSGTAVFIASVAGQGHLFL